MPVMEMTGIFLMAPIKDSNFLMRAVRGDPPRYRDYQYSNYSE